MKSLIIVICFVVNFGVLTAFSQTCEQSNGIEIRVQDENEKPVKNATLKFVDIPPGSALEGREFTEYQQSYGSEYVATYCESEIVRKEWKNGFRRVYDVLVNAKGYHEVKAKVSIYHCIDECLVNREFVTIVSESAKLVTIKGTVRLSNPTTYDGNGRPILSEKLVSGAPIKFKRSTMVEFSTISDASGNYQITVPAGTYSVYATAKVGCYMCAEYFGTVVGTDDTAVLNIILRFYGEGRLAIFEHNRPEMDWIELNR